MCMISVIHGMKVLRAISIDLALRRTVCQQSGVWQGGCTDSCRWERTQHLAECHHLHSQEVPAGEPRYTKGIYAEFTLTVIVVSYFTILQPYCWRLFRMSCATFRTSCRSSSTKTKCSRTRLTDSWRNLPLWKMLPWMVWSWFSGSAYVVLGHFSVHFADNW